MSAPKRDPETGMTRQQERMAPMLAAARAVAARERSAQERREADDVAQVADALGVATGMGEAYADDLADAARLALYVARLARVPAGPEHVVGITVGAGDDIPLPISLYYGSLSIRVGEARYKVQVQADGSLEVAGWTGLVLKPSASNRVAITAVD